MLMTHQHFCDTWKLSRSAEIGISHNGVISLVAKFYHVFSTIYNAHLDKLCTVQSVEVCILYSNHTNRHYTIVNFFFDNFKQYNINFWTKFVLVRLPNIYLLKLLATN